MSGYLQRLAGYVMQPVETVHPLVRSVFSAPETQIEREAFPPSGNTAPISQSELPEWLAKLKETQDLRTLPASSMSEREVARPPQPIQNLNLPSSESTSF